MGNIKFTRDEIYLFLYGIAKTSGEIEGNYHKSVRRTSCDIDTFISTCMREGYDETMLNNLKDIIDKILTRYTRMIVAGKYKYNSDSISEIFGSRLKTGLIISYGIRAKGSRMELYEKLNLFDNWAKTELNYLNSQGNLIDYITNDALDYVKKIMTDICDEHKAELDVVVQQTMELKNNFG